MNDLGVIDRFMETFIRYIDSGFGLLSVDVAFLTTILIGIDITLAGLAWAFGGEPNILGRLIRKVLYVGVFAFILNNFKNLADTIYRSFAGLGINASSGNLSADNLLHPGRIAATGFEGAWPLLDQASQLLGFPEIFGNALTIFVLLIAWFLVIIAFFILSIQLFITILEFKLTTLAGFVLVPFALWNRSAFLAERVLGNVISSGIKVMVLAVIVGIGSTLFGEFASALHGKEPDLAAAMSQVLGALALLGLGIFGPGIASGLVSGAPQLGAGAALGTTAAAAGSALVAGGAAFAGVRLATGGGLAAVRAGTTVGSAASSAWQLGRATSPDSGLSGVAAGMQGVASAAGGAAMRAAGSAAGSFGPGVNAGREAAWTASGGAPTASMTGGPAGSAPTTAPNWARRMRAEQTARAHRHAAVQAVRDGDRPGGTANPSLNDKDD
ncbi:MULTISPECIES: P-type conjugative transfer protein TrbL [Mesorhizobium]|uniref:P-type conjugative transfer protein TrbL n=1 Tax=Mesorhizobium TaxID=68287 RepID=UPI000BB0C750|nr:MULTISPECIES: P-type conjugative transfer protein TrbL [Mesorhizobium]PBB29580.1 P-type conjugative transfer protein TrbL [Mesorhizobium sp. WSM3882]PBB40770.1 P-type conjugative transfer protein TrbL [Mesorhizobium sp. WSM3866]PBB58910.1 P-type conjugative transfer protein TrbL [Mesorhizobium loti]PBB80128.1 P-type conjugative transfer protein TrbL [Mesorhizobium sp. WSM3879]PBB85107.1 P-type conjugative transfer protein TrbL [Mesorhizobium sp. WSM3876]